MRYVFGCNNILVNNLFVFIITINYYFWYYLVDKQMSHLCTIFWLKYNFFHNSSTV